jgi:Phage Mu protein F like protein
VSKKTLQNRKNAGGKVKPVAKVQKFEEAMAAFRKRLPWVSDDVVKELVGGTKRFAGLEEISQTWARKAQLDVVQEIWAGIDRVVAEGQTIESFKAEIVPRLQSKWGRGVDATGSRLDLVVRWNAQKAYVDGRIAQLSEPAVAEVFVNWEYSAILDNATTAWCQELDGVVKPANDKFWKKYRPPLQNHSCRSGIIPRESSTPVTKREVTIELPDTAVTRLVVPPGDVWEPEKEKYAAQLRAKYKSAKTTRAKE